MQSHAVIVWRGERAFAGYQVAHHPETVFASKDGVTLLRVPYRRGDLVQRCIAIEKARSFIVGYANGGSIRSTRGQEPDCEGVYTGLRRGDLAVLSRQHIRDGIISIPTEKTNQ